MPRVVLAAAVLGSLSLVAAQPAQCFERYQCIFHHDVGGTEYSWDMHQLCRGPNNEYVWNDNSNHTFYFNICGNTSQICAPNFPLYDSHGVAVQKWTPDPPCTPPGACTDWDTGLPTCCTGACAVLGTEYFQWTLIDPNNPMTGGVQFIHMGMPPDSADPNNCPINPNTGLARERQLTIKMYCDPSGSTGSLTILGTSEPSICSYVIETRSAAACGVKGDPFDGYRDNPGDSFGFVVLGAVLTVFVHFVYSFGNSRGWWDPIKDRMPGWCRCSRGGSSSSGSSYGGSYKSAGSSGATPITASAYGSA